MTKNIAAIPTVYSGVQFRSRLEARWAAFFDLVGWMWEYEPLELDGYIPDFRIEISRSSRLSPGRQCGEGTFLVEVKGVDIRHDPGKYGAQIPELLERAFPKIYRLKGQPRLLLGNNPESVFFCDRINANSKYYEGNWFDRPFSIDQWCDLEKTYAAPSHECRGIPFYEAVMGNVEPFWKQAGNITQWKGKQNRG